MPRRFNYCPHCTAPFETKVIHGIERMVCGGCDFIFWQNPAVGVAVVVTEGEKLLLGRRSRGVYAGQWCIPCGYVEYDEEIRAAAAREFKEETGLSIRVDDVYAAHSNFHNPAMHTVGIWFRGTVLGGSIRAADDLDAVAYHSLRTAPPPLAFPTDELVWRQLCGELI